MCSKSFILFIFTVWASLFFAIQAQQSEPGKRMLTIDDIFGHVGIASSFSPIPENVTWLPDGKFYLRFDNTFGQIIQENALTGELKPFHNIPNMAESLTQAGIPNAESITIARSREFIFNSDYTAAVIEAQNDLFYYEFATNKAICLTRGRGAKKEISFSPNGKYVSFIQHNNLYIVEIASKKETRLTKDGGPTIYNGCLDWVYQEEIYGRGNFRGYWWSPDSQKIAFLRLNETHVPKFSIIDHSYSRMEMESEFYPKAGNPNPVAWLGIVNLASKRIRWVDNASYQSVQPLIVRVTWTLDSQKIAYQIQNREQTWLHLNFAEWDTGKVQRVIEEKTQVWIEPSDNPYWLWDGTFLWLTERSGWKHLYHYKPSGECIRQITEGDWEIGEVYGIDGNGWIYYSSSEHNPIGLQTYRIKLDGTQKKRLTQKDGTYHCLLNPTFTHWLVYWSDASTPTTVNLYDMEWKLVREIASTKSKIYDEYRWSAPEFLQVKTKDGFTMEAMMLKPPDFDPKKTYPVLCHLYGGPHSPFVKNVWNRKKDDSLWHQMLAQKGYIVWTCDNRTASGKGAVSSWGLYRNFGESELADIEDGLNWLKQQPYIDANRIGIWGWSFGGYMVTYALTHSKSFKIGISVAPVTDWMHYNSIYTERYMGTPQSNLTGYQKSSSVFAASNLSGHLLLVHGAMDDNVHLQNTMQFVYALQKENKQFEIMLYPKARHGINERYMRKHLYTMMTQFVEKNL